MDDKLEKIIRSIDDLKRQVTAIQQKVNSQDATINAISKDVGAQDNKNMADILYKMEGYMSRDTSSGQSTQMSIEEMRRVVANIELMVKEIMKGMSTIYYAVDELEENIVPERKTQ